MSFYVNAVFEYKEVEEAGFREEHLCHLSERHEDAWRYIERRFNSMIKQLEREYRDYLESDDQYAYFGTSIEIGDTYVEFIDDDIQLCKYGFMMEPWEVD